MQYPLVSSALAIGLLASALPVTAQTAAPREAASAARPATAAAAAAAPKARARAKPKLARSAQKAVEERTPIDDDASIQVTDADLLVARQVHVGDIPCELGASVRITQGRREGVFVITTKGYRFLMHPVESRTGAIRLEDAKRGAMWLQLGNKSMLMSQKLGQRLADECQSPQQLTVADDLRRNPRPSILDAPKPMDPASAPVTARPPATEVPGALPASLPGSASAAGMPPAPAPTAPGAPQAPVAAPAASAPGTTN